MQTDTMWPNIDFKNYKLIVSDIDGTLIDIDQPLDKKFVMVINKLREQGVNFTVATGKNLESSRSTVEALGIELPMVLSNGCLIQDLDGRIYEKKSLPEGFAAELINTCKNQGVEIAINIGEDIYVQEINQINSIFFDYGIPRLIEVGDWTNEKALIENAYKCVAVEREDQQKLFTLEKDIQDLYGESVEYCHSLPEMLDFMPKGVSKENGIKTLAKKMDLTLSEIITMGDGINDIGMLNKAGCGLAVANGTKEARESAKWIIPSCADHGPLNFLEYFLSQIN